MISLNFVPKGPINNIPALVQITVSRRPDKSLSKPMMVNLLTYIKLEIESGRPYLYNYPEDAARKLHTGDGNDDLQFRINIFSYIRAKLFKLPKHFVNTPPNM